MGETVFLSNVKIFKQLNEDARNHVASKMSIVSHPAETVVIKDGDPVDGLYVIKGGTAKVTKAADKGGLDAPLIYLHEGDSFGEVGLVDGLPRSASVTAQTRLECYFLGRDDFSAILDENPQICLGLLSALASMVRNSNQMIAELI